MLRKTRCWTRLKLERLVGRVKDVKDVEKRLRHRLLPPFFELFMSAPKDELHQWSIYILVYCV
jgi:hypothetical protein